MAQVTWSPSVLQDLEGIAEFIFENYRIVYRTQQLGIQIAAVVHGSKLLPENLP